MTGETAWLLVADAAVVAVVLGAVAACLGVRAWRRRRREHGTRRGGRPAGRRVWTVAELRARENADQLQYYPQSPFTGANHGWPSEPTGQPGTGRSQPATHDRGGLPRTRHGR
jgi:hypothetical protein